MAEPDRYQVLMREGTRWADYIEQFQPPLSPDAQAMVLSMAVVAQEVRALKAVVLELTQIVRSMR